MPPTASKAEPIPELKFPGLTINVRERCIDVDATVCLSEGALELIACNIGGKVHESIVAVEARPSHIHTALLLLDLNGHEIAAYGWWQDKPHYAPWDSSASQHLKAGTNTIAVYSNIAYDESTKASYGQVDCLIEGLKISDLY